VTGDAAPIDDASAELCFAARALAQSHPMTEPARRYQQHCFVTERDRQPLTDFADWATTALLVGYCLRRVEEEKAEMAPNVARCDEHGDGWSTDESHRRLAEAANTVAHQLRLGDADSVTLLDSPVILAALDRLIATELDKREENVREQLNQADWDDLEAYIAWWVVHGYALRSAEKPNDETAQPAGQR